METSQPMTDRPLVGIDELTEPQWTTLGSQAAGSNLLTTLRALPAGIGLVIRLAWRASHWLTIATAVIAAAGGGAAVFGLLATADVLTSLLAQGPTPDRVMASLPAIATVAGSLSLRALLDSLTSVVLAALRPRVELAAQREIHTLVSEIELIAFEDSDWVDLLRQVQGAGVRSIESSIRMIADLVGSLVHLVAAVTTAGLLHPLLAPLVLLAVIPDVWASARAARMTYRSYLRTVSRRRRQALASELLTERATAAELRACTAGPALLAEYLRISTQLAAETQRVELAKIRVSLTGRAISGLGTGLGYGVLGLLLYFGTLPLALAATAMIAMRLAATALTNTMHGLNQLYENTLYIDLFTVLLQRSRQRLGREGTATVPGSPSRIALESVSFGYPGQDELALDDVTLTVERGQTIALVGENGSGKSTLVKLVTGLYQPTGGIVRWDDVDLAGADPRSVQDRVAMVMQEPARWPMTAYDNIRIGRLDRDDAPALARAARESGADEVISDLPYGGETVLSREFDRGQDLSGGQWQRISVARGLYRDAPVLIADEPTAAMDAKAEHGVFESLRLLGRGYRTTFLITHRLANIRDADVIVVLEKGKVVEQGNHAELIALGGRYAAMYDLQASAYQESPGKA
jgi:ATP-binding cassette subfamily B protein